MKLSTETRELYTNIITTAIENPYLGQFMDVEEYRWFSPTLDGGTAEPGPDNTPNAYAVLCDTESSDETIRYRFDVAAVSKARGVMRKVIADPDTKGWIKSSAEYLEAEFRKGYDEADFDASDAINVLQFGMFGYPVYG